MSSERSDAPAPTNLTGPRAIVAGHGDFAAGLVSAVEQITGRGALLIPVSVQKLSVEDIEALLRSRMQDANVRVIFTDLQAGSCTMASRRILRGMDDAVLIAGTNLPTLLDFVFADAPYAARRGASRRGARPRGDHRARGWRVTLELYRIDDRLIHGQVVVGWGQPLDIAFIVLVDDTVATSDWEQELYRMGVPPEMDVYFHTAADAIAAMPKYRGDARHGLLLTGDIDTMRRLVDGAHVTAVNVGGIHSRAGRTQRLRYVFLSPREEAALRDLAARGAAVTAQDVPGARPIALPEILAGTELS